MKILLVNDRYFPSGGPERYLFNIKPAQHRKTEKGGPVVTRGIAV